MESIYKTKQVIVVRKDLKMRRGKESAQVAHASLAVILNLMTRYDGHDDLDSYSFGGMKLNWDFNDVTKEWLDNSFAKVVVLCDSEEELLKLKEQADDAGIKNALIQDNGTTEFKGVPTYTTLAIGPDYSEKIDEVTGHLTLR